MPEQPGAAAATQIAELKVSGHLMALEPGLYCVYGAPGGGSPDPATGLPIVHIGTPPGAQQGRVKIAGLDIDGWIRPDSATLVRVTEAKSELLVTVYQAVNSRTEAPSIQFMRLAEEAAQGKPLHPAQSSAAPDLAAAKLEVVGHIYGRGDVGGALGNWMGEPGGKRWIEGFGIAPVGGIPASDIEYQAVLGRGWLSPWSEGGQFCGSRGMSLPILGLRVRLRGASAATHTIALSATFVDGTKVGPVGDAEACEAPSLAALEAFQLTIAPVGVSAGTAKPATARVAKKAPAKVAAAAPAAAPAPKAKPAKTRGVAKPTSEATAPAAPAKRAAPRR